MTKQTSEKIRDGICGICPAGCWIRTTMSQGKIDRVERLPDHPLGMICTIGRHSPEIVYDSNRLTRPLRRVGPKGSAEFEPITWDEAFKQIVENLESTKAKYGAEATAIYTGRGSFDMALCDLMQPDNVAVSSASSVLFPFGSPNTLGVGALCYVSFAMIAPHVTMGEMLITTDVDIEGAELIVLWGANPATDSPPLTHEQIIKARRRGADVIAIDPRRNGTARAVKADWIPVRPGTDGALALSMIEVLIDEELYDEDFVRDWTVGFDDLATLTQHYRPEVVEGITGVKAEVIRETARKIASARGAAPVMYTGLEYSDSGVQAIRAVQILWALAGQLDVPGGLNIRMRQNNFPQNRRHLIANPDVRKALGRDQFPVYSAYRGESHAISLPKAVLDKDPYQIRSLIVLGGSIITAWPDPDLWRRTLSALDFLVCIDRYPTADSAYADIVLPATTYYENLSYMRYGPMFKIREKLIEPQGEARNDFLILAELASRLGYGELFPQTEEEILEWALEGTEFSVDEVRAQGGSVQLPTVMMQYRKWEKGLLRSDGKPGFETPTGKLEIASTILAEHGYDPLPVYTEPAEGPLARPDLAKQFPLVFNSGGRTEFDFRSQHHGIKGLNQNQKEPSVLMNTQDAADRGITEGEWVWVETLRGRLRFRAKLTEDIVRGAVDAQMGGGGPLGSIAWRECNVNALTDPERYDPISGFPIYKTLLCQVSKDETGDRPSFESTIAVARSAEPSEQTLPVIQTRRVYLDNNATTKVAPEVVEAMLPYLRDEAGNPSSIHELGNTSRRAVEAARRQVANTINCTARRVVFTGSGSEANNLALKGIAHNFDKTGRKGHLITSAIEHPAVLATCRALEAEGHDLTVLPVDPTGVVLPEMLESALRDDTFLVSIMLANNETGAIQPISELVERTRGKNVVFHTDAVQALGKIAIDIEELGVDLASFSAHKVHGPKGIGALYVRKGIELSPFVHGGGQEGGLRSGTENVPGIVGFGKACEGAVQRLNAGQMDRVATLRDRFELGLLELIPKARRNGPEHHRLPNTVNLTLPGYRGESLVLFLDRRGVRFSSGSACKSGNPDPSHALMALGIGSEAAHCAIRLSLGFENTEEDVEYVLEAFKQTLEETASAVRFVGCR